MHDFIGIFGLQFFDDVQIRHLCCRHVGVAKPLGHGCHRHSRIKKQRRVRMTQPMNSDRRNVALFADGSKAVINGCVENAFPLSDK